MNKLLLCFVLILSIQINAQQDKRLKNIEKELQEILTETQAAGFAVAVVEKNRIIYTKGMGYSDFENKVAVDPNTLFAIGSSTKAFTSGILGQLRDEEDDFDFNDSPRKYLPNLNFFNDEMNVLINLKDLMSHRTGLPRHDFSWYFFPSNDKDSLVQRVEHQEPFTGVREQWFYNNFMFLLQGQIAKKITGKSWEDNIRSRFFEPLGMKRSAADLSEFLTRDNKAYGYTLTKEKEMKKMDYYDIAGMAAAGGIFSSVNEMSNWLRVWINGGKFNDTKILPTNYVSEAMSSQMVVGAGLPDKKVPDVHMANYGYGWMIASFKGHYRVEHGGNIDGFSASVAFYPSDSLGIVVLANQNGSAVPGLVRNLISDRMLKTNKTAWIDLFKEGRDKGEKATEEGEKSYSSSDHSNTRFSHSLSAYTGSYTNKGYGTFTITNENDSLIAHFTRKKMYLKPVHYDIFTPYEITDNVIDTTAVNLIRANFITNPGGDIGHLEINLEGALPPIEFERKAKNIDVDLQTLQRYVGEYEIATTTLKVYIKNEETLFVSVPGQPDYELVGIGPKKFEFKMSSAFKVEFIEDEKNEINALKMIQPQGNFTAAKKQN